MIRDEDIQRALSLLYGALGGDPAAFPRSRDAAYRAFDAIGAPRDVLALVASWRTFLTNRELLPLIGIRTRSLQHAISPE